MKGALPETQIIFNKLLNDNQQKVILKTLENIHENKSDYSLSEYWKIDELIGGIGGFNLPVNPIINPFPFGIKRSIFRPLQYAYSEMEIRDIRYTSRYVVMYSGMHLEAIIRYLLINKRFFGKIRNYNLTLGKAVNKINALNIIDKKTIYCLYKFINLYNKSKHEVNQYQERERLFSPADALVIYMGARILGNEILRMIDLKDLDSRFEINWN